MSPLAKAAQDLLEALRAGKLDHSIELAYTLGDLQMSSTLILSYKEDMARVLTVAIKDLDQ
jgi:hypothetical protein